jgi:Na+/glutamate symporter
VDSATIGIIAGSVIGALSVIVVVAVILLRKKKSKQPESRRSSKSSKPVLHSEQPYGTISIPSQDSVDALFEQAGVPRPMDVGRRIKDVRHIQ